MREFFHGWRRKIGCVTLVMACAVCGLWMRSRIVAEVIEITVGDRQHCFGSYHGFLLWRTWDSSHGKGSLWQSLPAEEIDVEWFHDIESEPFASSRPRQWVIPHAWTVAVLTLLAGFLILWKPRKCVVKIHSKAETPHA